MNSPRIFEFAYVSQKGLRFMNRLGPLCLAALLGASACGGGPSASQTNAVLENYATNLYQMYSDAVTDEQAFSVTVEAFLAAPSDSTLAAARTAWLASRQHYMLSEGARFINGPIDVDPPNYEAMVNSWPLDGNYIDYTTDPTTLVIDDTTGIINNPSMLADITVDGIDMLNAEGGDDNISDGYHAIEYLLWGQALLPVGPGQRPYTDYVTGGPRPNVDRRTAYLRTAIQGVIQHLTSVRDAWAPGATYRTQFVANTLKDGNGMATPSIALALTGMGKFSKGELAGERINAPYTSKSRRDQHDCFSSDTLTDYDRDARGVLGLYQGDYGSNNGPGFDELVAIANPKVNTALLAQLNTSVTDMDAIPPPFEQAIQGADTDPSRMAILATINSLRSQGDQFAEAASALGLMIVVPEEND
jgi:putative iron-regulated protein